MVSRLVVADGATVRAGELLAEMDSGLFRVKLDAAEIDVRIEEAEVALAKESGRSATEQALAKAKLDSAKAKRSLAELDLSSTRLTAPFDGRVGLAGLAVGSLVPAENGPPVCTVVATGRMRVAFQIDETTYLDLKRVEVTPAMSFGLAHEHGYPRAGTTFAVQPLFDSKTGTVAVRSDFDNKDGLLLPGMFVKVRLTLPAGK